jgi:endoglycosylceramidase
MPGRLERWRRRTVGVGAAALLLAGSVTGAGQALAAPTGAVTKAATAPRFATDGLWMVDSKGRELFLRGFDVTGAEDTPTDKALTFGPADFQAMRAAGTTVVRLPIAWAMIEPVRGHFDTAALARARQMVEWAREAGLLAVLDMHQWLWSSCFGGNGMPAWAVPGCPASPPTDPAVQLIDIEDAAQYFWDSPGLQSEFAQAWVHVVRTVGAPANLLGYDILNEPQPGDIPPEFFEAHYLAPFYQSVGVRLRAVDPGGLLFVEPSAVNGEVNGSSQILGPIGLTRVVYQPHQYGLDSFNADGGGGLGVGDFAGPSQFSADMAADDAVARRMGAAVWLGEWGALVESDTSIQADAWIRDDLSAQDSAQLGSAYWSWNGQADGAKTQPAVLAELTRITPMAVGGSLDKIVTSTHSTALTWSSSGKSTIVSVPASCTPVVSVVAGKAWVTGRSSGWLAVKAPAGDTADITVSCR